VSDEIQRKIERGDARNRANRKPPYNSEPTFRGRHPVKRNDFAVDSFCFLGGGAEGQDRTLDFESSGFDRFPGLARDQLRQFGETTRDTVGQPMEERRSGKGGTSPRRFKTSNGGVNRIQNVGSGGKMNRSDE
jgi:hypothetical protein